jgi:hypothetical protein
MDNNKTGNNIQAKCQENHSLKAVINTSFKKHHEF